MARWYDITVSKRIQRVSVLLGVTFLFVYFISKIPPTQNLPRSSFLRITKIVKLNICETSAKASKKSKICVEDSYGITASGFIVKDAEDGGTYVMTAAHVCDSKDDLSRITIDPANRIFKKPKVSISKNIFKGFDLKGEVHKMYFVHMETKQDLCLLYAPGLNGPPLVVADETPEIGEEVYNIAAPIGYSFKNMIPILSGYYSGLNPWGFEIYTIPVVGGSSGSPVLNKYNEVVGMIVMRLSEFDNVSLSPRRVSIAKFIRKAIKSHNNCFCSRPNEK
jgi:S1-C subfamily serine protease